MTKIFRLQDLDCPNCAAKMERAINKIAAVNQAQVNFLTQKLSIDADANQFPDVMQQVVQVCHKIEPDCKIII